MAARKDNKGRALRKGEFQRASDGKYVYGYVDPNGDIKYSDVLQFYHDLLEKKGLQDRRGGGSALAGCGS